jgi:predicted helicase
MFLITVYNSELKRLRGIDRSAVSDQLEYSIKWSRAVKNLLTKEKEFIFKNNNLVKVNYRPFVVKYLYFSTELNEMQYKLKDFFGSSGNQKNLSICFTVHKQVAFSAQITNTVFDYGYGSRDTQCLPLYRYAHSGERIDNITDWALDQFRKRYGAENVGKTDVFHYVYAVLHNPAYRQKYELNLKRDFPRIPFYDDFWQWAAWGKALMDLHVEFETVEPYPLERKEKAVKQTSEVFKTSEV